MSETDLFTCVCGWSGHFIEMHNELFEELVDGRCPQCATMLAIRSLPTEGEIRKAAARGIAEAVEQLASIEHHRPEEGPPSP